MNHMRLRASRMTLALILLVAAGISSFAQTATPAADGWVVLPVSEYMSLKHAALPTEPEPAAPPVEATLSRIDYDLKVDGDLATGEARLTVDVIKNGWVRIAMPDGLIVRDAKLDGRPVNLVMTTTDKGPGRADLLLSKTGRSVLTMQIVAPVTTVAGTDILHLPVSNSAVSHATVELVRQGVDVRITGGLLLEHQEHATGSRWVANGRGGEPLTFAWRRKVDDVRAKTVSNTQTGASLTARSDGNGQWVIAGVQPGAVSVNITAPGFKATRTDLQLHASRPARMGTTLEVGTVSETVTVTGGASEINGRQIQELAIQNRALLNVASQNVTNLQRRVAGILPVAVEVPKSGKSYRFVRPLVLEEETRVTFQYKSR